MNTSAVGTDSGKIRNSSHKNNSLAIIEEIKRSQIANRQLRTGSKEKNIIVKNAAV